MIEDDDDTMGPFLLGVAAYALGASLAVLAGTIAVGTLLHRAARKAR